MLFSVPPTAARSIFPSFSSTPSRALPNVYTLSVNSMLNNFRFALLRRPHGSRRLDSMDTARPADRDAPSNAARCIPSNVRSMLAVAPNVSDNSQNFGGDACSGTGSAIRVFFSIILVVIARILFEDKKKTLYRLWTFRIRTCSSAAMCSPFTTKMRIIWKMVKIAHFLFVCMHQFRNGGLLFCLLYCIRM